MSRNTVLRRELELVPSILPKPMPSMDGGKQPIGRGKLRSSRKRVSQRITPQKKSINDSGVAEDGLHVNDLCA